MKKHVYRPGDRVRIVSNRFIRRVGYNLVWTELIDGLLKEPAVLQAFYDLTGERSGACPVPIDGPPSRELLAFLRGVAMGRVKAQGFGGRERRLHYYRTNPAVRGIYWDNGEEIADYTGQVTTVSSKRVVKTGRYYPPRYYYEPGGLEDARTHVLLETTCGLIETCDVELVQAVDRTLSAT